MKRLLRHTWLCGFGLGFLLPLFNVPKPTCETCGTCHHVRRVCRAVPSEKEVRDVAFNVTTEEICLPGPPKHHKSCQDGDARGEECRGGRVRCRKLLEKKDVVEKQPAVKFEVHYICDACQPARKLGSTKSGCRVGGE